MKLVTMKGKNTVCDSLEVAKHFHKRHKNMIQSIERLAENSADVQKMFEPKQYTDSYGRVQKKYYMNRDGFSLLVMGFTGKEAIEWKIKYIEAFNQMEYLLLQKQTQVWQDSKAYATEIRKAETDVIKEYVQYATEQGSKHAERYYSIFSTLADKTAGISAGERENATIEQLTRLSLVENIIQQCIADGIAQELPYKEIYQCCKQRAESFTAVTCLTGIRKGE